MALSISRVVGLRLDGLNAAAADLRSNSNSLGALAASAINAITKIAPDWSGEAATVAAIRAKDRASTMEERAARWDKAAGILDKAAEQIGKLQSEIIRIIDDPVLQHKFDIFDDGQVTVSKDYENDLLRKHLHNQAEFDVAYEKAEAEAARLSFRLRTLLNTVETASQYYDWQVENALLGVTGTQRPFRPRIPPPSDVGTTAKDEADKNGSGPSAYGTHRPSIAEKQRLAESRSRWRGSVRGTV